MCGITGIVSKKLSSQKDVIQRMTTAIAHRGPDGDGIHYFNECALGHRRLSIIDLSTGDQPMLTADGRKVLVFNGEIYGYKKIKEELSNYQFRTSSDTEVILALYDKYGADVARHLPGMFAFALWDDEKRQLVCARDRFGEKPFFYAIGKDGEFIFASELKSIIASGLVEPELDRSSLIHYLRFLYVNPRKTIYKNIFTLPPASQLVFKDGGLRIDRYWSMPELNNSITMEQASEQFSQLLHTAVANQLIADVPVGAFLSGGLDSSTIVAVASKYKQNIKTFSFGFRDSIDETGYAKGIAKKYGTDHVELYDDREDLGELLMKMTGIYDEPFADSSNIPTYLISKLASKQTKVVLTGDGADELLGGYAGYKSFLYMQAGNNLPLMHTELAILMARIVKKISLTSSLGQYLYNMAIGAKYARKYSSIIKAHVDLNIIYKDADLRELGLNGDLSLDYGTSWTPTNTGDDAMRFDLENYMPGDILVKTDRASMANGLELRAPFLDVDFASFCISLPFRLKVTKDSDKFVLRRAFANSWTESIQKRKKQGFGAPVALWQQQDSIARIKHEFLDDKNKKIFNIISFAKSRKYVARNNYYAWLLLVLSLWMEKNDFKY